MLCFRDRTFCETPSCGNPKCSRILSDADRDLAQRLGLPIAYAMPCLAPKSEDTPNDR